MVSLSRIDWFLAWVRGSINGNIGLITFLGALVVLFLYLVQKNVERSNVAKLILQEIRYAEHKVQNFRSHDTYKLSERVLPTNNWNGNISLFVKDLEETAIDRISDFYSNAEHLDGVIKLAKEMLYQQIIAPIDPSGLADADTPTTTGALNEQAKKLISKISYGIGNLDNTPITGKLREIAHKSWYKIF